MSADKIRERLKSLSEAREKATVGPWKLDSDFDIISPKAAKSGVRDSVKIVIGFSEFSEDEDLEFITLAANEWTNLIAALEIACEALEVADHASRRAQVSGTGRTIDQAEPSGYGETLNSIAAKLGVKL